MIENENININEMLRTESIENLIGNDVVGMVLDEIRDIYEKASNSKEANRAEYKILKNLIETMDYFKIRSEYLKNKIDNFEKNAVEDATLNESFANYYVRKVVLYTRKFINMSKN